MKKSEFASLGIISEHDLRYIVHHMRDEERIAAKRKVRLDELPERLQRALKNSENVRRIDRGTWQILNVPLEYSDDNSHRHSRRTTRSVPRGSADICKFRYVSYEILVYQEGIVVFESYSEDGEGYPGEDAVYGRNSFSSSCWIPFDEE